MEEGGGELGMGARPGPRRKEIGRLEASLPSPLPLYRERNGELLPRVMNSVFFVPGIDRGWADISLPTQATKWSSRIPWENLARVFVSLGLGRDPWVFPVYQMSP